MCTWPHLQRRKPEAQVWRETQDCQQHPPSGSEQFKHSHYCLRKAPSPHHIVISSRESSLATVTWGCVVEPEQRGTGRAPLSAPNPTAPSASSHPVEGQMGPRSTTKNFELSAVCHLVTRLTIPLQPHPSAGKLLSQV